MTKFIESTSRALAVIPAAERCYDVSLGLEASVQSPPIWPTVACKFADPVTYDLARAASTTASGAALSMLNHVWAQSLVQEYTRRHRSNNALVLNADVVVKLYPQGAYTMQCHGPREHAIDARWQRLANFDASLVLLLLDNVTKPGFANTAPPSNTAQKPSLEVVPRTTAITSATDDRDVAVLESRQQRDAILLARDFRAVIETLINEEHFSSYDLQRLLGVSKANLSIWRGRPLGKLRQDNARAMGRLLFAWKFWLHETQGEVLGPYVRHVPEGCASSLMQLLAEMEPSEQEIVTLISRLASYAAEDRRASAIRRRDLGGLPSGRLEQELSMD